MVSKFSFSTNVVLATIVQLPPSMIILHTLLLMRKRVWKIFSLRCSMSSSLTWEFSTHLVTSAFPAVVYSTSSLSSSVSTMDLSPSLSLSTILSLRTMTLLFGHCDVMWRESRHLKHFISLFLEDWVLALPFPFKSSAVFVLDCFLWNTLFLFLPTRFVGWTKTSVVLRYSFLLKLPFHLNGHMHQSSNST